MSNLNWHQPLEQCVTLDEIRAQWHALLDQNQMGPTNPTPGYQDAMLSFIGGCALPPALKMATVLALGSAFDFDFRLAVGALAGQTMEDGVPWPESVSTSVSDNGPALGIATSDAWLGAFIAGRMAGLRETFSHDGTRPEDWQAAFWNRFLEMACRHAAQDAVRLALQHGADPRAGDYLAVSAAARGMHHENFEFRNYNLSDATDADYGSTLLQLVEGGFPAHEILAVALRAAAGADNTAMLDFLLAQGADIRTDGGGALAAAARHLASDAFVWLLENGADIKKDNDAVLAAAVATLTGYMVEDVLEAGAELQPCANQLLGTALAATPYDLYPEMDDIQDRRADIMTLLLRRGAHPAGREAIEVLKSAPEGRSIIETVLERGELDAELLQSLRALVEQAFGQADDHATMFATSTCRLP